MEGKTPRQIGGSWGVPRSIRYGQPVLEKERGIVLVQWGVRGKALPLFSKARGSRPQLRGLKREGSSRY